LYTKFLKDRPPRRNTGTGDHMELSALGKTPPAWIYALRRHSPGDDGHHQHDFYLSEAFDNGFETVFLCQICHNWFFLKTTGQETCDSNHENNLHHLHTKFATRRVSANCCLCQFSVDIEIKDPLIDMRIFDDLSKLRMHHTYANALKTRSESEFKASFSDVIHNMIKIVDNVLNEDLQALQIDCQNFKKKTGLDEARLVHLFYVLLMYI